MKQPDHWRAFSDFASVPAPSRRNGAGRYGEEYYSPPSPEQEPVSGQAMRPDENRMNFSSWLNMGVPGVTAPPHGMQPPPVPSAATAPPQRRNRPGLFWLLIGMLLLGLLLGLLGNWVSNPGSLVGQVPGEDATSGPVSQSQRELVAANFRPSVVQINVQKAGGENALGSGVIIDKRGYIVTNNHVVSNAQGLNVTFYDGRSASAELTGVDPLDDLAVIKVNPPKNMAVAQIGDSSQLRVGEAVLAIGNPLGITQTVTSGIVSALGRTVGQGDTLILNAVQTDAAINPGNSGGALVNMGGKLIGIPTLVPIDPTFNTPASGVGFAIPSNRLSFIVPQLIKSGHVTNSGRADLGVRVISVDPALQERNDLPVDSGALVVDVRPGGPADQAGLQPGDIIVQVDKTTIYNAEKLLELMSRKSPGETVSLTIYRDGQQRTIQAKLGEVQISRVPHHSS